MKESAKRLLQVGQAKGYESFSAIAKALGESGQTATNWKARGVSAASIIEASVFFDVSAGWLAGHPKAKAPDLRSGGGAPIGNEKPPMDDPVLSEIAASLAVLPREDAAHFCEIIKAAAIVARSDAARKAAKERREQEEKLERGRAINSSSESREHSLSKERISGQS